MVNEYPRNSMLLKYNPQLDGLRFCAVLFVVSYHWLPSVKNLQVSPFLAGMVNFFFVLSSYLITRILFSAKEKTITMGIPKYKVISVFLLRRTIRIFPAYYFFLLLVLLLPTVGGEIRNNAGMYFSYLANYHMFESHDFPSVAAHIWTLAVEEQFYLVWPLLIIFIPSRYFLNMFLAIIIGIVIYRAISYRPEAGVPQIILTQYCVDAFAVGALLAYKTIASREENITIDKYFNIVLYAGISVAVLVIVLKSYYFSFVFNRLLFAMVSMKIIEGAVNGYKGFFGKFLQNRVVIYLGRISYGIYLYHLLVPVVFWKLYHSAYHYVKINHAGFFSRHHKEISMIQHVLVSQVVSFIIYAALVVVIATLSSKFIEKPLNKLKVGYSPDAPKPVLNPINKPIT